MGRGKRGRPRAAALRRQRASAASERLSKILERPWSHSDQTVNEAASQLWSMGRRHRIGLPPNQRIYLYFVIRIMNSDLIYLWSEI